ncbi:MAG: hypothetical protein HGA76_01020 [Candidatus Firestonebacteria bacterium]|nr:hypothetical protein [Candidatus Firestonebacteria bacterium]
MPVDKTQASIRAVAFLGAKKWIMTKYGEKIYKEFLSKYPDLAVVIERKGLLPVSWLPMKDFNVLANAIIEFFGQGGTANFQEMCKWVAGDALSTTLKVFMKLGTPSFIATAFPGTFAHYFTIGKWTNLLIQSKRVEGELREDSKDNGPARCMATMAWARGALEYSGAKNLIQLHPECIFKGGSRCYFVYTWD